MANIIPTVKSDDISVILDNIANDFHLGFVLKDGNIVRNVGRKLIGEVEGLEGILNSNSAYEVRCLEIEQGLSSSGDWGYYAKQLTSTPSQWLKVWVRWNAEEANYDYYLKADVGEVFSHATPYVGGVRREV